MEITVTVTANSVEDLKAKFLNAASTLGFNLAEAANESAPAGQPDPQPEKRGRGRPPKAKAPEPVQPAADDGDMAGDPVTDDPDAPQPTYDDVVNSLKDVNSKHGWSAVRAIILPYGAQKISEVKPCDFVAVIAAAKEKAAA